MRLSGGGSFGGSEGLQELLGGNTPELYRPYQNVEAIPITHKKATERKLPSRQ
ncbi:hypothetical protein F9C07_4878 [Aspergillus flavus]|uniref:Uncharacterized protein n=1 Tax=Aspergillus flavus (strain ATCC 200026 / FGSC A1120 / IAM 13836 / NRRL 3357 / JCM 12722 / SRRC 167) TaxID=332952 RepID=A0A7U2QUW4_ASPFN|nr:hypothetical protein F9C07_4878 [Aspergillus flavus]